MKKKILIVEDEFKFGRALKALLFSSSSGVAFIAPNCLQLQAEDPPFNRLVKLYQRVTAFVQLLKSPLP